MMASSVDTYYLNRRERGEHRGRTDKPSLGFFSAFSAFSAVILFFFLLFLFLVLVLCG